MKHSDAYKNTKVHILYIRLTFFENDIKIDFLNLKYCHLLIL